MTRSFYLLAPLVALCAHAQDKGEVIAFIKEELRSLESADYRVKEVYFSPSGDTVTYRRTRGFQDRTLLIPLKNVDIYYITCHRQDGPDTYRLMVKSRGPNGNFMVNGRAVFGARTFIRDIPSQRKAQALERAFTRLTALTTGRTLTFDKP